jgi:hypothetical protein
MIPLKPPVFKVDKRAEKSVNAVDKLLCKTSPLGNIMVSLFLFFFINSASRSCG